MTHHQRITLQGRWSLSAGCLFNRSAPIWHLANSKCRHIFCELLEEYSYLPLKSRWYWGLASKAFDTPFFYAG